MQGAKGVASTPARSVVQRQHAVLGLKVLAGLLIIAAPIALASLAVPGVFGVAFFGVLAATFGWISGGPRIGAAVVLSLSVLGVVAIMLRENPVVLAAILLLLGVAYGLAARRGVGKAVLQLPILVPYFMMSPPPLFSAPPAFDAAYFIGVLVVVNATGAWAILVLHLALGKRELAALSVPDPRVPVLYGTVLGLISALVMLLGTTTGVKSHWVWVTLTLYVLADPTQLLTPKRMLGRLMGTFAGFAAVALMALFGIPDPVLQVLAFPALWLCLTFLVIHKPYWEYSLFLTISVVLMNSRGISTLLLDAERFAFTLVGAGLAALAAVTVHWILDRKTQSTQSQHDTISAH
ncbi:FUSC family protein [Leucobacter luti]|uniref:FUSC family protein n=1 Tax=Leucobacter luti TaxID=340320 RepID=UPI001C690B39|nr:FUSC family protein [Leucobacter luti]QYM75004.1 FUSC family protein [Leucobacter luti]